MKKRNLIIIGLVSVALVSTLGIVYYRRNKKKKADLKIKKEGVKKDSRAFKITSYMLEEVNKLLSNYEYKDDAIYDVSSKRKIGDNALWSVWGVLHRNYNNLLNGVNNDDSIDEKTRAYALSLLDEYKKSLEKVFPSSRFNSQSKDFTKYNLDKAVEVDVYNSKI